MLYLMLVVCCMGLFIMLIRRKLLLFSDALCEMLDDMLSGDAEPPRAAEEESLFGNRKSLHTPNYFEKCSPNICLFLLCGSFVNIFYEAQNI